MLRAKSVLGLGLDTRQFRGVVLQLRWSCAWQVSSHGRVRTSTGAISFGSLSCSGYYRVVIQKQAYYVHRLVAAAFLGPPPSTELQVNHLDGDSSNNHVANLEYVTPAENLRHSWATNPHRKAAASKLSTPVEWRRQGNESWSWCASQAEAAKLLGVHQSSISQCCRGLSKKCRANGLWDGTWYEFRWPPKVPMESNAIGEEWRPATYVGDCNDTFPGLLVSNHGRVSQLMPDRQIVSYGTQTSNGYFVVHKAGRLMLVHRIVAATFLGQPSSPKLMVNHVDCNRGNNRLENLEYVTNSQNVRHALSQRAEHEKKARQGRHVQARKKAGNGNWKAFSSIAAAALATGVQRHHISRACKSHGDNDNLPWEFKFVPEDALAGEEWRPVLLEGSRQAARAPAREAVDAINPKLGLFLRGPRKKEMCKAENRNHH